jgi:hypothetical protein
MQQTVRTGLQRVVHCGPNVSIDAVKQFRRCTNMLRSPNDQYSYSFITAVQLDYFSDSDAFGTNGNATTIIDAIAEFSHVGVEGFSSGSTY